MRRGTVRIPTPFVTALLSILTAVWFTLPLAAETGAVSPQHMNLIRALRQARSAAPGTDAAPGIPVESLISRNSNNGATDSDTNTVKRIYRAPAETDNTALIASLTRRLMATGVSGDSRDLQLLRTLNELNGASGGTALSSAGLATLDVEPINEIEPNDNWLSAQTIQYGVLVTGEAIPDKDVDIYSFSARQGDFVRIEGRPTGSDGWTTTLLFDPDSNLVSGGLYGFGPTDQLMMENGEKMIAPIWGGGNVIGTILERSGTYRIMVVTHPGQIIFMRGAQEDASAAASETPVRYSLSLENIEVVQVAGRVLNDRGEGIQGAELYYWSTDFYNNTRVVTGQDGSFSTGLPEGEYHVSLRSPEGSRYPHDQIFDSIRVGSSGGNFEYVLKSGVIFSGSTREDRGPAAPWVSFGMWEREGSQYRWGVSDSTGAFSVAVFPDTFSIYVSPGWQYPVQPIIEGVVVVSDTRYDLIIDTGNRISGRVLDPDGKALALASIIFYSSRDARYAVSGQDGLYEVALTDGDYNVTVTPQIEDLVPAQQFGPLRIDKDTALDLRLSAGAILSGSVADSRGNPVRNALIYFWQDVWSGRMIAPGVSLMDPDGTVSSGGGNAGSAGVVDYYYPQYNQAVYTDETGRWSIALLPGTWVVEVIAPTPDYPYQQIKAGTFKLSQNDRVETPKIVIEHGSLFSGKVLRPDGSPLQYGGFFMYSGGDLGLVVPADGREPALYYDKSAGMPVDGQELYMPYYGVWVSTDNSGNFRQRVLPAVYSLQFQGETGVNGYPSQTFEKMDISSDRAVTIRLEGGYLVSGKVVTTEGKAVEGCYLGFYSLNDRSDGGWAWSDREGNWALRLTGGDYMLQVNPVDGLFPDSATRKITVKADTRLEIRMNRGVAAEGVVTDKSGRGVPGVMIQLLPSGAPGDTLVYILPMPLYAKETAPADAVGQGMIAPGGNVAWTDENGYWSLRLSPGAYDLFAWPPAQYAALYRFGIDISRDVKLELVLTDSGIRVSGKVERENGLPADNVLVSAWDPGSGEHASAWTDAAGRYEFMLPAGKYEIVVDGWQQGAGMEVLADMELTADSDLNVRFGTGLVNGSQSSLPKAFALAQNSPNPFNPSTTIQYFMAEPGHVRLSVYDLRGRVVANLVDRQVSSGVHTVQWDGRDRTGRQVASGVYFYRMNSGSFNEIRKMILLK